MASLADRSTSCHAAARHSAVPEHLAVVAVTVVKVFDVQGLNMMAEMVMTVCPQSVRSWGHERTDYYFC